MKRRRGDVAGPRGAWYVGAVAAAIFFGAMHCAATAASLPISGTVFEDVNYGGGSGRSMASAGGVGLLGVTVELYNSSGTYVESTTTAGGGTYSLANTSAGTFIVRVVTPAASSRTGGTASGLIAVQTYRTDATTGTPVTVTDHVGGQTPSLVDAAANTSATLASLTTGTTTPQSITTVIVGGSAVSGVDFGYNFDTIVNVNLSGQGSLYQFITNANALGGVSSLAQVGQTAGTQTTIFMVSAGNTQNGLTAVYTNLLTSGYAAINYNSSATGLPSITNASTVIDGTTQTANVPNTNPGSLGTGGTVGTAATSLSTVTKPTVQLYGDLCTHKTSGACNYGGIVIAANNVTIRGLSIQEFGSRKSGPYGQIYVTGSSDGTLITNNLIGTGPTAFYSTILTSGDGVYVDASGRGTIQNNLIGYMESCLIEMNANATSAWTISGNQLSALYSNAYNPISAIVIDTGSNITVSGNLINGNAGSGLESLGGGGLTVTNNTISGNGSGGTSTANQTPGIDLASTSSTISGNIINGNYGAGVLVESGSTTNTISQNSIYGNGTIVSASGAAASGEIGIDLLTSSDTAHTGTSKFITPNKSAGTGTGGDSLLNFPFIDSAYISGASLIVTGYARPGATVEFFVADASPASGFGQGKTYFASAVEGSASDSDSTFGIYNGPGVSIGTDTTNRFRFIIAKGSISAGSVITASATLAAYGASEFGPNFTVTSTAPVPAMVTVLSQSPSGTSEPPGTVMTYTGVFTNSGAAQGFGITMRDAIPTHTDFQIGSAATAVDISNLTPVTIVYSSDSGATWTYTPVSGGGGASSGYDRLVTNVKFIFGNSISFNSPYNTATFSLSVRIQ